MAESEDTFLTEIIKEMEERDREILEKFLPLITKLIDDDIEDDELLFIIDIALEKLFERCKWSKDDIALFLKNKLLVLEYKFKKENESI